MRDHYHELSHPASTVTVRVGDTVVARSADTILLREVVRGRELEGVYYFPVEHVVMDALLPTTTKTHCPIKGHASYWSYSGGDEVLEDAAWGYGTPIEYSQPIAGRIAFDTRRASIDVG